MNIVDKKEELGFWIFVLAVLSAGISLMVFSKEQQLPVLSKAHQLAFSVGEALVIAATLAITVDKYLKRRLIKELFTNSFHFLIGHDLPAEAQERIREVVTKSTLIRRDCLLEYKIEVAPSDPEKVRVELATTVSLDNITSQDIPYQFRTCTSCSSCESARVLRLWCRSRHTDSAYDYPSAELRASGPDGEGTYWFSGKKLRIPAKNLEKDIKFEIGAKYETLTKDESDREDVRFRDPTLGVRVRVDYCADDFTVYPTPKPSATFGSEWFYDRFFVPGEQVAVRWVRKAPLRRKSDSMDVAFKRLKDEPEVSNLSVES